VKRLTRILYDLDQKIQVMGTVTFGTGRTYEYDGVVPEFNYFIYAMTH
jgi:hypothetical protein